MNASCNISKSKTTIIQYGRHHEKARCSEENCVFCLKCRNAMQFSFMIIRALYQKYSASQNYYYTRDINDVLCGTKSPAAIMYKDLQCLDFEDEFLKRFYKFDEYQAKIAMLSEYYKFHRDIARLFMLPQTRCLNKYHDKKRRLEYIRITRMLQQQEAGGQQREGGAQGDWNVLPNDQAMGTEYYYEDEEGEDLTAFRRARNPPQCLPGLERILEPLEESIARDQQRRRAAIVLQGDTQNEEVSGQSISSLTIRDLKAQLTDIVQREGDRRTYAQLAHNSSRFSTLGLEQEQQGTRILQQNNGGGGGADKNLSGFLRYLKKQQQQLSNGSSDKALPVPKLQNFILTSATAGLQSSGPLTERAKAVVHAGEDQSRGNTSRRKLESPYEIGTAIPPPGAPAIISIEIIRSLLAKNKTFTKLRQSIERQKNSNSNSNNNNNNNNNNNDKKKKKIAVQGNEGGGPSTARSTGNKSREANNSLLLLHNGSSSSRRRFKQQSPSPPPPVNTAYQLQQGQQQILNSAKSKPHHNKKALTQYKFDNLIEIREASTVAGKRSQGDIVAGPPLVQSVQQGAAYAVEDRKSELLNAIAPKKITARDGSSTAKPSSQRLQKNAAQSVLHKAKSARDFQSRLLSRAANATAALLLSASHSNSSSAQHNNANSNLLLQQQQSGSQTQRTVKSKKPGVVPHGKHHKNALSQGWAAALATAQANSKDATPKKQTAQSSATHSRNASGFTQTFLSSFKNIEEMLKKDILARVSHKNSTIQQQNAAPSTSTALQTGRGSLTQRSIAEVLPAQLLLDTLSSKKPRVHGNRHHSPVHAEGSLESQRQVLPQEDPLSQSQFWVRVQKSDRSPENKNHIASKQGLQLTKKIQLNLQGYQAKRNLEKAAQLRLQTKQTNHSKALSTATHSRMNSNQFRHSSVKEVPSSNSNHINNTGCLMKNESQIFGFINN